MLLQQQAACRIADFFGDCAARGFAALLSDFQSVSGFDRFLLKIVQSAEQPEVNDSLAAVLTGCLFRKLNFELKSFLPCGSAGPYLLIARDGQEAFVQVRRLDRMGQPAHLSSLHGADRLDVPTILVLWCNAAELSPEDIDRLNAVFQENPPPGGVQWVLLMPLNAPPVGARYGCIQLAALDSVQLGWIDDLQKAW